MENLIAIVQTTAFMTAAILIMACLVGSLKAEQTPAASRAKT